MSMPWPFAKVRSRALRELAAPEATRSTTSVTLGSIQPTPFARTWDIQLYSRPAWKTSSWTSRRSLPSRDAIGGARAVRSS